MRPASPATVVIRGIDVEQPGTASTHDRVGVAVVTVGVRTRPRRSRLESSWEGQHAAEMHGSAPLCCGRVRELVGRCTQV